MSPLAKSLLLIAPFVFTGTSINTARGQDQEPSSTPAISVEGTSDAVVTTIAEREQNLARYLSGAKLDGLFTVDGKEDATPKREEYTIAKCEKLPEKDMYRFTARIKYGDTDQEVPLDLQVLWAGRTPVITLDSFWIPGMGTFGARVMLHSGRYAGTWQHDDKGGHLYGKVEQAGGRAEKKE